ncbi:DNA polymerase-3 subunit beta [Frankia sp. EI5c]|uniref:DNA polymerase III subunit beta n=1 Tax=Frankia sp. EI5c TaxID=683316 RepID=UPI0007C2CE5E|nr:DNA polymerase III subunit beta [Frankia sp. EI5c]OAA24442.1 DNA polymerase-3 subunit beta [Frankia sp. EI5c]
MRFSVERDVLADATGWAARYVPKPTGGTQQVLTGLLLEATLPTEAPGPAASTPAADAEGSSGPGHAGPAPRTGLTVSAFDGEVAARAPVGEAVVTEAGRVVVPGRLLADVVRNLPDATVVVEATDARMIIECGSARFRIPTLAAADYPVLPEFPPPVGEVDTLGFAAAVAQVAPAAGRDDTLAVLTAVRLEIAQGGLTLVATDRYRLAVRTIPWQPTVDGPEAVAHVPARLLADVARLPTGASRVALGMGTDDSGVLRFGLAVDGRQTIVRLLEGTFPNYRRLLPEATELTVTAQTAVLAAAVRRVALVATRTAPLRFVFSAGQVVAEAGEGGGAQASELVPVEYSGPELSVLFNPAFLLDGLAAVEGDEAIIAFVTADPQTASSRPVVLTGKDDGEDYRYLLMPIRTGTA